MDAALPAMRAASLRLVSRTTASTAGPSMQVGGRGGPSGLAHISELSDGFVGDIHSAFRAGQGAPPQHPRSDHSYLPASPPYRVLIL